MNAKAEQVGGNSAADIAKLALALIVLAAGVVGYYWFNDLPTWQRLLMLLGGFVGGGAVGYFTRSGHALRDYFSESIFELRKVVWPTRKETIQTTAIVFAFVVIMALFLWAVDASLLLIVKKLMGTGE